MRRWLFLLPLLVLAVSPVQAAATTGEVDLALRGPAPAGQA